MFPFICRIRNLGQVWKPYMPLTSFATAFLSVATKARKKRRRSNTKKSSIVRADERTADANREDKNGLKMRGRNKNNPSSQKYFQSKNKNKRNQAQKQNAPSSRYCYSKIRRGKNCKQHRSKQAKQLQSKQQNNRKRKTNNRKRERKRITITK